MRRATTRNILLLFASLLALAWVVSWQVGCELYGGLGEAKAVAADARIAAEEAKVAAEASGDPEAVKLAEVALVKADAAEQAVATIEQKAIEMVGKYENGELGAAEGREIGGLLGGLAGPAGTAIGTIVGGIVGGVYYRWRLAQVVRGLEQAAAYSPNLSEAFSNAKATIHANTADGALKLVEKLRIH